MSKRPKGLSVLSLTNPAFKIAASVALVMMIGFLFYLVFHDINNPEVVVETGDYSKYIHLPDSSFVTMYHNTTLSYSPNNSMHRREISMQNGEAFFNVVYDAKRPFLIHTPLANIEVVGTAFNVTLNNNGLAVGVSQGKVAISNRLETVMVEAGFTGWVQINSRSIAVIDSVNANDWAYATRRLTFRETPMEFVIKAVEKTYQNSIVLSDKDINNCRLTATFEDVSAENLLALIAEAFNLSVKQNGREFILEGKGCP